jgi:uncharacterized protein (DUF58 family)
VADTAAAPVPLYPRRRLLGAASGGATSIRRGGRADVASSRPYQPGDHLRTIDWKASARLSSASGRDEFIVRERFNEETPAVVIVVDRRPAMALYPPDLPWLHKHAAVREVARVLVASALNHRSLLAYLDFAVHPGGRAGEPFWQPPRAHASVWRDGLGDQLERFLADEFDAPEDNVALALEFLGTVQSAVPIGSFVFVISDFIAAPAQELWAQAVVRGWDVVPVIVQDPTWEQSFPPIDGVVVSFGNALGAGRRRVRLSASEVDDRRALNEARLQTLRHDFLRLGLDPILVGDSEPERVHATLLEWANARLVAGRGLR